MLHSWRLNELYGLLLQTEFFALEGITQLVKTIDRIKVNLNPALSTLDGILVNYVRQDEINFHRKWTGRLEIILSDKVYKTVIPRTCKIVRSHLHTACLRVIYECKAALRE